MKNKLIFAIKWQCLSDSQIAASQFEFNPLNMFSNSKFSGMKAKQDKHFNIKNIWAEKAVVPDVKSLLTGNKSRNKHVF